MPNKISFIAAILLAGALFSLSHGASSAADYIIQKDKVGRIQTGISRKALYDKTYDPKLMKSEFMERHLDNTKIYLPDDPQRLEAPKTNTFGPPLIGQPLASMVVHFDNNTVRSIYVLDPRFKTKEGLGRASKLGDIRALHPDLSIKENIIHESFDGGKPGEYAEVHHPYTVIDGVFFQLQPANYLKYRPSDTLPDDTPISIVSVGEH